MLPGADSDCDSESVSVSDCVAADSGIGAGAAHVSCGPLVGCLSCLLAQRGWAEEELRVLGSRQGAVPAVAARGLAKGKN